MADGWRVCLQVGPFAIFVWPSTPIPEDSTR